MSGNTVIVKQGWLRGATVNSVIGGTYISFKGIPFAAPPVGNLRFKDPQPPAAWTGIRNAHAAGPKCAQFNMYTKTITGDDDCLYLNVATKSLTGSRPVMVWIHGGAFVSGAGDFDMHGPDYLMESDIVYVGINYRVGVLGFLQLNHEAATGNMGLKDQVAALKWVKENIAQFGGDSNNITIFGVSAGGASIHYLLASPLAKGLFHKAIMQSGAATSSWARILDPVENARRYVAALGKDISDPNEIVEYLRTVPAHKLIEAQQTMAMTAARIRAKNSSIRTVQGVFPIDLNEAFDNIHITALEIPAAINKSKNEDKLKFSLPFGPTLDDKSVEPFLPRPFEDLISEGFDVPVIFGYSSHEGAIFSIRLQDEDYTRLDENFEASLPEDLVAKAPSKIPEIARELRKSYFGDDRITKDSVDNYIQYHGDLAFVMGIHKAVDIQLKKKSPTYLYKFSYGDPKSTAKLVFPAQIEGAVHSEESQYLFFRSLFREHIDLDPGSTTQLLRRRFVRMWTDFGRTGNPTPLIDDLITDKWEPVSRATKNYLKIHLDISADVNPDENRVETWKRIDAIINEQ